MFQTPISRTLTLNFAAALFFVVTATAPARAAAWNHLRYSRLEPIPPDPKLSAAPLTNACIQIRIDQEKLAERLQDCAPWKPVLSFCNQPLTHAAPSASEAAEIAKGRCPVPEKTAVPETVQPKAVLGGAGMAALSPESIILEGLAAFMVERAEQEAVLALAERTQSALCRGPKTQELFPTVCALLGTDDDVYDSPPSWTALRAATEHDLSDLPLALLEQHPTGNPDRDQALLTGTDLAEQSLRGNPPLPLFAAMAARFEKVAQPPAPGKMENPYQPSSAGGLESPYRTMLYIAGVAAQILWPAVAQAQNDDDRMLAAEVSARLLHELLLAKGVIAATQSALSFRPVLRSLAQTYQPLAVENNTPASEGEGQTSRRQFADALARSLAQCRSDSG